MIRKLLIQLLLVIGLAAGLWFLLSKINWRREMGLEKVKEEKEDKIAKLVYDGFLKNQELIVDSSIMVPADSILKKLCRENDIDTGSIHMHIIHSDIVNAFALPGGHLVVYTGLIEASQTPAEIAGVICHEIAHIRLNHVMKKLITEVGLSALAGGSEIATELIHLLSSSAYSRKLEREADIKAMDYMEKAGIDPEGLANFLYRLSTETEDKNISEWMSSHPDSRERSAYLMKYRKWKKEKSQQLLTDRTWQKLKASCRNYDSAGNEISRTKPAN